VILHSVDLSASMLSLKHGVGSHKRGTTGHGDMDEITPRLGVWRFSHTSNSDSDPFSTLGL
jgi:hypothetical protein